MHGQGQNNHIEIIAIKNGEDFVDAGYSTASITAKVTDKNGNPVKDMLVSCESSECRTIHGP